MSKHSEKFEIQQDQETVMQACRYAFKEMQVAVQNESANSFTANEKMGLLAYANPAKIEVSISSSGTNTSLNVNVSNFGFGPIQGKHCRSVANTFMNAVKVKAKETSQSAAPVSDADELKKYAELKDQGIITEEEFNAKKKQILGL
tara:strand:- start:416 stop:853 length:438 start_codon:yes stop_codon:yes gene_type:complete